MAFAVEPGSGGFAPERECAERAARGKGDVEVAVPVGSVNEVCLAVAVEITDLRMAETTAKGQPCRRRKESRCSGQSDLNGVGAALGEPGAQLVGPAVLVEIAHEERAALAPVVGVLERTGDDRVVDDCLRRGDRGVYEKGVNRRLSAGSESNAVFLVPDDSAEHLDAQAVPADHRPERSVHRRIFEDIESSKGLVNPEVDVRIAGIGVPVSQAGDLLRVPVRGHLHVAITRHDGPSGGSPRVERIPADGLLQAVARRDD